MPRARRTEPAAFGISIRPDAPDTAFVGTNCGVARTTDGGATWTFVDPTPGTAATDVWDVVAQAGGIVDVCGDDGHFRSTDNGVNWTAGGAIPGGRCSIAVSPDESYVVFIAAADNNVYESDNGGANWTNLGNQSPQGRIPFVVTNQRSDDGGTNRFDLWYSDTQLFRAACTTPNPAAQGGAARCPTAASWTNHQGGAHWDAGHLVFDTAVAVDACPRVYSTDGGAHTNTVNGSPGCHAPTWVRSNVGLHALWAWTMDGANRAGDANEDLYFGNQDNGTFGTTTAGTNPPTWTNPNCCDTFDVLADPAWALGTTCCFGTGTLQSPRTGRSGLHRQRGDQHLPDAATFRASPSRRRMARFGTNSVALLTSTGLNITTNITANPIVWTSLGQPAGANACGVWSSVNGGATTFFLQAGQCTGAGNDTVWSYAGTAAGGTWTQIDNTDGITGGFGVFGADPNNPNRLYASNLAAAGPRMVFSTDGGTTWDLDPELDTLMTGGGVFAYQNQRGPRTNRGGAGAAFSGYPQPSMVAYDPENANLIAAGGDRRGRLPLRRQRRQLDAAHRSHQRQRPPAASTLRLFRSRACRHDEPVRRDPGPRRVADPGTTADGECRRSVHDGRRNQCQPRRARATIPTAARCCSSGTSTTTASSTTRSARTRCSIGSGRTASSRFASGSLPAGRRPSPRPR